MTILYPVCHERVAVARQAQLALARYATEAGRIGCSTDLRKAIQHKEEQAIRAEAENLFFRLLRSCDLTDDEQQAQQIVIDHFTQGYQSVRRPAEVG